MLTNDLYNIGFSCYIKKSDVLGIYSPAGTIKKLASKTYAPSPTYVANNLNGRKCQCYIETPFHLYLCAYPVDIMKEVFEKGNLKGFEAIRPEIEGEELLKQYQEGRKDTWQGILAKENREAVERAKKAWAAKIVQNTKASAMEAEEKKDK